MKEITLCFCGSGLEYQLCCLGKILPFSGLSGISGSPSQKTSQTIWAAFRKQTQVNPNITMEEAHNFLEKKSNEMNYKGRADFLDLSPFDMNEIIYQPFSFDIGPLAFTSTNNTDFSNVPFVKEALYFLNIFKSRGPLKATQKGNLPRAIVREIWELFYKNDFNRYPPMSETDSRQVVTLHTLLTVAGYIKKRQGRFSLTKKGEKVVDPVHLFGDLFLTFANQIKWSFADGYSSLPLIQNALAFNLYILYKKGQSTISGKELGQIFYTAFPVLQREVDFTFESPSEEIINCFRTRFIERFALPFGLIEKLNDNPFSWDPDYKITPFFLEVFKPKNQ